MDEDDFLRLGSGDLFKPDQIPLVDCDSPIEDMFLWDYRKVADDKVHVDCQYSCQTRSGLFRIDFVLSSTATNRRIGIECDGKNFHSATRDSVRDAAIIASCSLDCIYRLRGRDIHSCIHQTLHLLSRREPWILSRRGESNLNTLCGPEHNREDYFGPWTQGFPHAAIRHYLLGKPYQTDDEDDCDYDGFRDNQAIIPKFPTIICWTASAA